MSERGQLCFPGIGSSQLSVGNLIEKFLLLSVLSLGVYEKERIAQFHLEVIAVVLGKLVLIESVERPLQSILNLT